MDFTKGRSYLEENLHHELKHKRSLTKRKAWDMTRENADLNQDNKMIREKKDLNQENTITKGKTICRVSPGWIVRFSNESASAIQPRGMEEHPKCLRSPRKRTTVGSHRKDSGEAVRSHFPSIEPLWLKQELKKVYRGCPLQDSHEFNDQTMFDQPCVWQGGEPSFASQHDDK
eukprot:10450112-Heterocapsa_arctica.AAC.1